MNRPELYKKTVDILYQAYFSDTLQHANCHACAVGNLVLANMGYSFLRCYWGDHTWANQQWPEWQKLVWSNRYPLLLMLTTAELAESKRQIEATGYTVEELGKIEDAFEMAEGNSRDGKMFNGLVAVLDCLTEIHEIKDEDNINNDRFKQHYQKRLAVVK
jgi:hypothetical protein